MRLIHLLQQTTNMDRDNAHVDIGGVQSWLYANPHRATFCRVDSVSDRVDSVSDGDWFAHLSCRKVSRKLSECHDARWQGAMVQPTQLESAYDAYDAPVASRIMQTTNMATDNAHDEIGGVQSWLYPNLHRATLYSRSWKYRYSFDNRRIVCRWNTSVGYSIINHPSYIICSHPEESHGQHSWVTFTNE